MFFVTEALQCIPVAKLTINYILDMTNIWSPRLVYLLLYVGAFRHHMLPPADKTTHILPTHTCRRQPGTRSVPCLMPPCL